MTTQPEALWLAEYHECAADLHSIQTAAELRRLHEANEAFGKRQEWWNERMFVLEQQRDALLEKITAVIAAEQSEGAARGGFIHTPPTKEHHRRVVQAWKELHAAIRAVEEQK